MKIVFFGGGGLRTLPIARAMLDLVPNLKADGEITLCDLSAPRLEAMSLMLQKSPEFAAANCKVNWTTSADEALPGADMVSMSMMAIPWRAFQSSQVACAKHDFMGSDQISPSGAILGLVHGKIAYDLARKMEQHCPNAWLIDFANPVPVISAVVNNHTKIRALGICGGFNNHQWDLTRLQGRDEQDTNYDVDVAGVNHGSFIIRGTYKGEDLWKIFDRILKDGFHEPEYNGYGYWAKWWMQFMMPRLLDIYRKHHCTIFSTEGDGVQHYFYEEFFENAEQQRVEMLRANLDEQEASGRAARVKSDAEFQALAHGEVPADYWVSAERWDPTITVLIAQALGGGGEKKIAASFPARGNVEGFKDRAVLEYSLHLGPDGLRPVPNLYVPDVFQGMVTELSMHQTLLGDAIATEDPQVLYEALRAYPVRQNSRAYWALCEDLLTINKDVVASSFQGARQYFW